MSVWVYICISKYYNKVVIIFEIINTINNLMPMNYKMYMWYKFSKNK